MESIQSILKKTDRPAVACRERTAAGKGSLPACAPLANPYVPFQGAEQSPYAAEKALIRGTLFPGLDLPYLGMVNKEEKRGPLAELQALGFAINELGLYLDTHPNDTEAAELFDSYVRLYRVGAAEQSEPLCRMDGVKEGKYVWSKGPWPWEYGANEEG